jgi:hypothetical protein
MWVISMPIWDRTYLRGRETRFKEAAHARGILQLVRMIPATNGVAQHDWIDCIEPERAPQGHSWHNLTRLILAYNY